jgi:uncharacterized protein YqhQ
MNLWLQKEFIIETTLTPDEVREKINSAFARKNEFRLSDFFFFSTDIVHRNYSVTSKDNKMILYPDLNIAQWGVIFKLYKKLWMRVMPLIVISIDNELNQTQVKVKVGLSIFFLILLIAYLLFLFTI